MRVAPEQIERANLVNLPDFLRSQGFALKQVGREYILQEHDSLHIKDNKPGELGKWFRFSENKGGNNIQFVQEFMGLDFKVTKDTLIPRPDTEILVENTIAKVNENFGDKQSYDIVDIGTGSGAIILSLLKNLPKAKGFTVDISANAIAIAKENAQNLQVDDRCEFFVGDLFEPVKDKVFDVIVSNPPYIPQKDIATLEIDVKDYEPLSALTDNKDGLSFYQRLFAQGMKYLKDGGFMAVEIGIYQAEPLKQMAIDNGWQNIEIIKDYAGIDRVVLAWKQN